MQEQIDPITFDPSESKGSQSSAELPEYQEDSYSKDDERICRHCGGNVPPGAVLCPECGCWWSRQ